MKSANHPVPRPAAYYAEAVSIPSKEHAIAGWWNDTGQGLPIILLIHGIRADRASMVSRAQVLAKHGFSTLLIDLQGHGETPADAITFGYRESNDVTAAIAWIKARAPNRKVGVIGCSLGGAALLLAPQPLGVDAIVLEEVFPRIGKAVENRLRLRIGPLAPFVAPLLLAQLGPRLHIQSSDLEPIRYIAMAGAPILIAAGADDLDTTLAESNELFQAAQYPKDMWVVKRAKHQDLLQIDPSGYESHVLRFLIQHLRGVLAPTHKLGKSEIQDLIDEDIRNKRPLTFTSNQGVIHCCDLGEPSVRFAYDHRAVAFGDGYVPWMANFSYEILVNGTISFGRSDTTDVAAWVKKADLENAAVYSYGDSLYMVKASEVDPDLSFDPGTAWPFKENRTPPSWAPQ